MEDALLVRRHRGRWGTPTSLFCEGARSGGTVFFDLARIAIIVVNIGPTAGFDTVGKTGTEIQFQKHLH